MSGDVHGNLTDEEYQAYVAQRQAASGGRGAGHVGLEKFAQQQNDRIAKRHDRLQKVTVYEQILAGRDERMLERHEAMEKEWQRHRDYVSKRLDRRKSDLVVSKAEEFREKVELFDLLDRATPVGVKSGGYSWYHSLRNDGSRHVQVGNMFSGLSFLMKMRKENYVDELVRKERLVEQCQARRKTDKDQAKTWRDDEYLVARLRRYRHAMNQMAPGRLDYEEMLVVEGKACNLYPDASDLPGPGVQEFHPEFTSSFFDDSFKLPPYKEKSATPDGPPAKKGPHIEVFPSTLEFYVEKGKTMTQDVTVRNVGTSVVYLTWTRAKPVAQLAESTLQHDPTSYFHCVDLTFKLLPGQSKTSVFAFNSITAGSFCDAWRLVTEPTLLTHVDDLFLVGLCTQTDTLVESRERFAKQMREIQLENQVHEMVNDVVLRVKTATPPPPDFSNPKVQEKIFEERNAPEGLYWSPYLWDELHKLVPRIQKFVANAHAAKSKGPKDEAAKAVEAVENAQILNLDDPDPELDVYVFEWDKSVAMLEEELSKLRTEAPDYTLEELCRILSRLKRHGEARPVTKSPAWHPAHEAVLAMVDTLPDVIFAQAEALSQSLELEAPLVARPFIAPDDEEREAKMEKWEERKAAPLAAAIEKMEDVEAKLDVLPVEPFVASLVAFEEQAQESVFRDALLAPAPSLVDSFALYTSKVNTEADIGGMVVLYEIDLAVPGVEIVNGKLEISDDTILRERLAGVQDIIDAGPQALFLVGHIGEPADVKVEDEHEWDKAASPAVVPSLEPVFEIVESLYRGAAPNCDFLTAFDVLEGPPKDLRGEPEGKLFMIENLAAFYEETGVIRLENGKVRRMPWAEREGFASSVEWKFQPEFYILDSFAAANKPTLMTEGLWAKVPQRILGAYVEQEIQLLQEVLKLTPPEVEEEGAEIDPYADLDEKKPEDEAAPTGPMLCFLGGSDFGTDKLLRKCELFRGMVPLLSERVCLGGDFALYALETYLNIRTGLEVPPYLRATLNVFFASMLTAGAQVYLPLDVVCELKEQPPPPPPPENLEEGQEPPPPPEPLPEIITVDLRPALRVAAHKLAPNGPILDSGKGWLRVLTPEERSGSVETADSWLEDLGQDLDADVDHSVLDAVPENYTVRDIGPETVEAWKELMRLSRGLIWHDALGVVSEQFTGTSELVVHVQNRHEDEGDDEDEEEEEEDEDEEEDDEDGNPIEREPKPPKIPRIPSVEFETSILLGAEIGTLAESSIDTSLCAYITPSEEIVELFRGKPAPGLAKLADKPKVKPAKKPGVFD